MLGPESVLRLLATDSGYCLYSLNRQQSPLRGGPEGLSVGSMTEAAPVSQPEIIVVWHYRQAPEKFRHLGQSCMRGAMEV